MRKSIFISVFFASVFFQTCNYRNQGTSVPDYEFAFQDPTLDIESRVADLVSRLTLEEKILQLFNAAPAIDRLGIPAYNWWNECLHGVARAGKATVFPQAIGLAATFDEGLMLRVATTISDEARAKHHNFARNEVRSIYTGLTFWSPNINIFRDPRWGRGQETYGEDPYLTGRMAVNFIQGLQGDDPRYFKTIATAKHYAVHSGPEHTRHVDNFNVNDRDLYTTYLPAFKAAVKDAHVQSIMCAYNRFRDKPCCGSDLLLDDILREKFGFDGYVVSDCGAISDFYMKGHHNVVERPSEAWGWSLASGTDLNCEENRAFVDDDIKAAIQEGIVNEEDINLALARLFSARFKLGLFDPDEMVPFTDLPYSIVGSQSHLDLALEATRKSLVLLKNEGVLPLENVNKIALIGPNADNEDVLLGNYNGLPINPVTPLKGLQDKLGKENILFAPGAPLVPGSYGHAKAIPAENLFHMDGDHIMPGLRAEYFTDTEPEGTPAFERIDPDIDFLWERTPIKGLFEASFAVRWTGILKPDVSGAYQFGGNVQVKINGINIGDIAVDLSAGENYNLEAEYVVKPFWWSNTVSPWARLTWVNTTLDYVKEALEMVRKADLVVFCGGISPRLEGEEMNLEIDGFSHGDRTHLKLPEIQEALLQKITETGKPVIYVNFSGSAIGLNWEDENLSAIIQAFYPGEQTGTALAQLLLGDFSPSGKLPVTFYRSVDDLPEFKEYAMKNRTYRYYTGDPLYPFGFGLSYTTFEYDAMEFEKSIKAGSELSVRIRVRNSGNRDATEVVQLYLTDQKASVPVPLKSLVAFRSISLQAGEERWVEFSIQPDQMAVINSDFVAEVEEGDFNLWAGGSTGTGQHGIEGKFHISGNLILE